jgi:hypothetical protein
MVRLFGSMAALALGGFVTVADLSPPQRSLACQGVWQTEDELAPGDAFALLNEASRWPGFLSGDADGGLTLVTGHRSRNDFDRVRNEGEYWFVYDGEALAGMLSGVTGRLLLETDRGLFRAVCIALPQAPAEVRPLDL